MDKPLRSEVFIVTGGGGFVGKALIQRLLKDGAEVRSLSRRDYSDLTALGVQQFQHDLSSESPLPDGLLNGVTGI
ncbi:MAG: NAD-dependent epimerase/dehydratase family protein, partial [Bdellovibrionales bacterium]|nr:NAD-dependent epimerase/dehydratase family protein [Bdellovibrionales bacterium]